MLSIIENFSSKISGKPSKPKLILALVSIIQSNTRIQIVLLIVLLVSLWKNGRSNPNDNHPRRVRNPAERYHVKRRYGFSKIIV
jgi:hypothetical protein